MNRNLLARVLMLIIGLLVIVGLVINFTPALSTLRGQTADGSPSVLNVNGVKVSQTELDAIKRSNPVLNLAQDGLLGDDIKTFVLSRAVQNALVKGASADVKVSRTEVNTEVNKVRQQYNLTSNKDWTAALAQSGTTDADFRVQVHDNLQVQGKVKQITDAAPKPSDAQLKLYYQLHAADYKSDPRVRARLLSVADEAKARSLLAQLKGGADFAKLASANSLDYKDRGGAVAAVTDGKVTPVTQAALQPAEVGTAAFALTNGGLSDVVKSGNRFYVIKVEEYLPAATKPYDEVKADVSKKVGELIGQQAQQDWLDGLQKNAKVEMTSGTSWGTQNPVIATVDGTPVYDAELIGAVLSNQQLGQLLQQAPDQAAGFINGLYKPQVINQLIQGYAAAAVVKRDKLAIVGPRQNQVADLAAYGTRDFKVSDADVQAYYTTNKAKYQTPASADVDVIVFPDKASALAFRQNFPAQAGDVILTAAKVGGTLTEMGATKQGETDPQSGQPKLSPALDKAVFAAGRLQSAADGSVSDVVEAAGRSSLAFVHDLVPAKTTPLTQVRSEVEQAALTEKTEAAKQAYLDKATKGIKTQNNLQAVLAAQTKRVQAASATSTKGTSATSTGATSATSGTSGQ